MKYYKNSNNQIYAYEDDYNNIPAGLVAITEQEKDAILESQKPAPVPVSVVTMRQARLALLSAGKLAEIETAIEAMPAGQQKEAVKIEWEFASTLERDSATTQMIGAAVGMTAEQVQDLFTAAAGL